MNYLNNLVPFLETAEDLRQSEGSQEEEEGGWESRDRGDECSATRPGGELEKLCALRTKYFSLVRKLLLIFFAPLLVLCYGAGQESEENIKKLGTFAL